MSIQVRVPLGHEMGDVQLGADIKHKLNREYPGWDWDVGIDDEPTGGVFNIISKVFVGDVGYPLPTPWGVKMHITTAYADPSYRKTLRAVGLMLEFCGQPQRYTGGPIDYTEFARNYETYNKAMNYGFGPKD